jgi:large subunit ribosomal protein L35
MAYKLKTNKSVLSRFKVSATGKLIRHHAKTSHLLSVRSGKTKRKLGRPGIVSETHAGNLRALICKSKLKPKQKAHFRAIAAKKAAKAETAAK